MQQHLHPHDIPGDSHAATLLKRATFASVTVASLLVLAKLVAWWKSDSLSILSSLTDSLFDLVSSALNFVAIRYALKPADDDHRFGHNSIEDIASLAQAAFITASMLIIILQSAARLFTPAPITHEAFGIAVSLFGMVATALLVSYQSYVARHASSSVLQSDRLHYLGDVAFNVGVLVALGASLQFGWQWADPAMALLIALAVLWSSRSIGIRAYHNLMDREMPDDEKATLYSILSAEPDLRGYHNLKTRYSGSKPFIQLHAELNAALGFQQAHDIIDRLEKAIEDIFPGAEVIIHPDPVQLPTHRAYDA